MSMTGQRDRVSSFYQIGLGKIRLYLGKEAPENMAGITERVNRNGDTVYEVVSDYISGKIVGLSLDKPEEGKEEFGARLAFTLENPEDGEKAILYMKWDSAYGRGFIFASPNIDLSRPVEFEPYQYTPRNSDKKKTGLSIIQDGSQLDWAFGTKANPGGCPPLKEVVFKGKTQWDNSEQLKFLEEKLEEFINKVNTEAAKASPVTAEPVNAPDEEDDDEMF